MKSIINLLLLTLIFNFFSIKISSAQNEIRVFSRQNYYTNESDGEFIVIFDQNPQNKNIILDFEYNNKKIINDFEVSEEINIIPFSLNKFPSGESIITCFPKIENQKTEKIEIKLIKLPPAKNAVKIDNFSGGLIVDGLPYFPFGFYCYSPVQPTLAEEEVVKGYNMMSPYQLIEKRTWRSRKKYMDRCAELGMKVHYNLLSVAGLGGTGKKREGTISFDEKMELLRQEILQFKDHPALLAWYICDEPTGHGSKPEELKILYNFIKEIDPYHPITIVFMNPDRAKEYSECMDIVMADPYPIPNSPITNVSDVTSQLFNEFRFRKPVWIVPQAFGGNEHWMREPTASELRAMTYLAIIKGAIGIQYFIRHGLNSFPKSTTTWNECAKTALEIAELTPVLFSKKTKNISCTNPEIIFDAWKYSGHTIVIAVNTKNQPLQFEINLNNETEIKSAEVLFENRFVEISNNNFSDMIDAYGSRVYAISESIVFDTEISGNNLIINPGFENNPSTGVPSSCYAKQKDERGATYFIDSRIAKKGTHSLRLTTPKVNQGFLLSFFPVKLKNGRTYCFSIWAKSKEELVNTQKKNFFSQLFKIKKQGKPVFRINVGNLSSEEFVLSTKWKKYSMTVKIPADNPGYDRYSPSLELLTQGTAWFDEMEIYPDPKLSFKILPENKSIQISLSTNFPNSKIRYTTDGCIPTKNSILYSKPIDFQKSFKLKATVFENDQIKGELEESFTIHKAFGVKPVLKNLPNKSYTGGGEYGLTNGISGSSTFNDGNWQGFLKRDFEVVLDLNKINEVNKISLNCLQNISTWIFMPQHVEFFYSDNNIDFVKIKNIKNTISQKDKKVTIKNFSSGPVNFNARYLKIIAKNIGLCPEWHNGKGKAAWLFVDEIVVE